MRHPNWSIDKRALAVFYVPARALVRWLTTTGRCAARVRPNAYYRPGARNAPIRLAELRTMQFDVRNSAFAAPSQLGFLKKLRTTFFIVRSFLRGGDPDFDVGSLRELRRTNCQHHRLVRATTSETAANAVEANLERKTRPLFHTLFHYWNNHSMAATQR